MRWLSAVLVAVALTAVSAAPADAKKKPKPPNPCKVLLPADLETIFEQPWRHGVPQLGGACTFQRPSGVSVPNIVVSLIVEQKRSPKKAKQAFARSEKATRSIVDQIEPTKGLGQRGYLTTIIGADVLSFWVRRYLVEVRVDRVDRPQEAYHDQILAIGSIVEARLLPPPPTTTSTTRRPRKQAR
ncbi:MAG TPA: hypothetical protein VIH82_12140 [Acidimicrobiia bacterium]|jgi:hypothetical protein